VRCFRAALPSLLALAGLAACGDVHRPFQPDDKPLSHALLRRTDHAGVIVMPLSGAADDVQSLDFGAALAAALRAADVLAHNGAGNRDSPVLSSYLERGAADDGNLVLWLSNGAGTDIGTYEFRVRLRDLLSDTAGRRTLLRNLAQRIAAELDPERARARATPPVFIARMDGLPAAQSAARERAIAFWLQRAQVEIAERPGPDALVVAGGIGFQDRPGRQVTVDVVWRVLAGDGGEIGRVTQRNELPAAMLSDGWGDVAAAIAETATEGIVDLVARARSGAAP
jgi:hypothetical protein